MKQKADPRHLHRVQRIKDLFSYSFSKNSVETIADIIPHLESIDNQIAKHAPEWPLSQINKVDLSILRLALFEIEHTSTPHKVVIDEAIELAKEYGSDSSAKFINGVLGSLVVDIEKKRT